jgi:hypothetical protein
MKFPNLVWATSRERLTHYRLAAAVGISESRFSRCLSGRAEFCQNEREAIARELDYTEGWLFQEITPPEHRTRLEETRLVSV